MQELLNIVILDRLRKNVPPQITTQRIMEAALIMKAPSNFSAASKAPPSQPRVKYLGYISSVDVIPIRLASYQGMARIQGKQRAT